jgi:hypothetical protein
MRIRRVGPYSITSETSEGECTLDKDPKDRLRAENNGGVTVGAQGLSFHFQPVADTGDARQCSFSVCL